MKSLFKMNTPMTLRSAYHSFKGIAIIISIIGIVLVLIWARAFYGSMQAFDQGENFLAKGEPIRAVTYYDRSLHWYAPFSPYVSRSAERLWQISQQAERNGDLRLAMIGVKTLRRGYIAARSWWLPGKDWIERCDRRVRKLLLLQRSGAGETSQPDLAEGSSLDDPQVKGPDVLWSLAVLVGFLGWVGSAAAFIVSAKGGSRWMRGVAPSRMILIVLCAFFWIVWIVGMIKA